MMTELLFFG